MHTMIHSQRYFTSDFKPEEKKVCDKEVSEQEVILAIEGEPNSTSQEIDIFG